MVPNAEVKPEVVNTNIRHIDQRLSSDAIIEYAKARMELVSAILATTTGSAVPTSSRRSAGSAATSEYIRGLHTTNRHRKQL